MELGVIYGLPDKYATTIRMKNLINSLSSDIKVKEVNLKNWEGGYPKKGFKVIKNTIQSLKKLKNSDVIYFNAPLLPSSFAGNLIKKIYSKPIIVDWDDAFIDFRKIKPSFFNPRAYYEYKSVKKANKLVVVSKYLRNVALDIGVNNNDVSYISNGVDTDFFDPKKTKASKFIEKHQIDTQKNTILFLGRIGGNKNEFAGKEVANATIKLLKEGKELEAMVVGDGPNLSNFKKYVSKMNCRENFIFTGFINRSNVRKAIKASDICVNPLKEDNFSSRCRSSVKIKEYMSMAKKVVATGIGENKRDLMYGEAGYLVEPGWRGIKKGLVKAMEDEKSENEFARKVAKKKFDWNVLSKKFHEIIKRID
ncbi:MAG: Glycosyltransferase, RfaG family [Candidatus Methanohalarchaeum thermophilum]|uniref:Glycosyltransferase, RfaG family n=1 Tax=Methanohalarchaeum thermophilum TaxID=1903181 RepID=A0A1Q6DSP8_METT1|nr:MAG: Glycosyltransferase, RfaG family [Candidatus Methanohalarchaeum thermophilum]